LFVVYHLTGRHRREHNMDVEKSRLSGKQTAFVYRLSVQESV